MTGYKYFACLDERVASLYFPDFVWKLGEWQVAAKYLCLHTPPLRQAGPADLCGIHCYDRPIRCELPVQGEIRLGVVECAEPMGRHKCGSYPTSLTFRRMRLTGWYTGNLESGDDRLQIPA